MGDVRGTWEVTAPALSPLCATLYKMTLGFGFAATATNPGAAATGVLTRRFGATARYSVTRWLGLDPADARLRILEDVVGNSYTSTNSGRYSATHATPAGRPTRPRLATNATISVDTASM